MPVLCECLSAGRLLPIPTSRWKRGYLLLVGLTSIMRGRILKVGARPISSGRLRGMCEPLRRPGLRWIAQLVVSLIGVGILSASAVAQESVLSLRLYVLDCGDLGGASPLAVPVYLVVHPRGSLLWEAGTLPDSLIESGGSTEKLLPNIRRAKASKTLKSQ